MNREDFNILNQNIIYFDNAATSLKPKQVINSIIDYYNNYSANAHRGDYNISLKVDLKIEETRKNIKEFINASNSNEIIFTYGTTDSINKIVFGYYKYILKENDEIILSKAEHASNLLPWFELAEQLKLTIKYIDLTDDYKITIDNLNKVITDKTKVISLAYITNVVGDIRPIKEISKIAKEKNISVLVDAAQAVPHIKIDVQDLNVDFLAFSGHKVYGPTGIGVLYGKEELLNSVHPTSFGGGMNASFDSDGRRIYDEIPLLLEAGTPNIAGIIGLNEAISYINNIGVNNIKNYETSLRSYAIDKLKDVKDIIIYNKNSESSIITINIKDIFAQDLAIYLNKYNICVRSGNHCAKILKEELNIKNTVRISLSFYNTKEEIDYLVKVLNNPNLKKEIL